jgi:hypothetical protein
MSLENLGNQVIQFRYKHPLRGIEISQLLYNVLEKGIYSGGELTIISGNNISLSSFVIMVPTSYLELSETRLALIRFETKNSINFDTTGWAVNSSVVLYATYTWVEEEGNYLDFSHGDISSVPANAVIFGTLTFDSGGNLIGVSNNNRTVALTQASTQSQLDAHTTAISLLQPLVITSHKNYNSDVLPHEVNRMGYYNGYIYIALVAGTGGAGRWGRFAIATAGF